jgi:uncharacterized repeat protein (TIGR03803 family)
VAIHPRTETSIVTLNSRSRHAIAGAAVIALATTLAAAQSGYDIYRFPKGGHRGFGPYSSLTADSAGNLYGTTQFGGTGSCTGYANVLIGCGTVFRLTPPAKSGGSWTQTVLYNFLCGNDGCYPLGGVIFDTLGNLYGTTQYGGGTNGLGTVFKLSPPVSGNHWSETILHSYFEGYEGMSPSGNLLFDQSGNLYGTTGLNQAGQVNCPYTCGTVFQLTPPSSQGETWKQDVIFAFDVGETVDGQGPLGGLVFDAYGNLYGTTNQNGGNSIFEACADNGCGEVFELSPPANSSGFWAESLVHGFADGTGDGLLPYAGVIADSAGNLYGTTEWGGNGNCWGFGEVSGCGTVYELTPSAGGTRTESILYQFQNSDGSLPSASLVMDDAGNLYGTTGAGGTGPCSITAFGVTGCGTVFKLAPPSSSGGTWAKTTLFEFSEGNGYFPASALVFSNGALYGTTAAGGEKCPAAPLSFPVTSTCGTVFRIIP